MVLNIGDIPANQPLKAMPDDNTDIMIKQIYASILRMSLDINLIKLNLGIK